MNAFLIPDRFSCAFEKLSGKEGTPVHGHDGTELPESDTESGSIEFLDGHLPLP